MQPLLSLVILFGLMYLLLIRPQQRRMRQHQAVVSSLRAGDEIVTAGGIYGTVVAVDEDSMIVEVAPGVELRILRAAVSQRITPDEGIDEEDEVEADEVEGEVGGEVEGEVDRELEGEVEEKLATGESSGRTQLQPKAERQKEEEA